MSSKHLLEWRRNSQGCFQCQTPRVSVFAGRVRDDRLRLATNCMACNSPKSGYLDAEQVAPFWDQFLRGAGGSEFLNEHRIVGLLDMVRVPQAGLSNRALARLPSQPVRWWWVDRGLFEIAEQSNAIEFQICTVALRTCGIGNAYPKERHLSYVSANLPFEGSLSRANRLRGTAADTPRKRQVFGILPRPPKCCSNPLSKN